MSDRTESWQLPRPHRDSHTLTLSVNVAGFLPDEQKEMLLELIARITELEGLFEGVARSGSSSGRPVLEARDRHRTREGHPR